ncbi:phosphatase 2C-like domain-containing protein [Mycena capillaripes]|nr:phosphatase 2C-like domain-containing protein [Mycena capillaripes]
MIRPFLTRRAIDPSVLAHKNYSSLQRPYIFHTAANWAGKPPWNDTPKPKAFLPDNPVALWRDESIRRLASPGTPRSAGEDFFLCLNMRHNSGVALGVADGVGGWIDQGIDCSMFSQALMYNAHRHFENGWAAEPEIDPTVETAAPEGEQMTPSKVLQLAYHDVLADETVKAGSSTACLLTLNASGMLRSANLGDSGFCIIRSSSIFYNSSPQTHYFNCPWQLAKLPPARGRNSSNRGSINDSPSMAQEYSTRLIDGDVVVAYTDGLADNVFPSEILKICALVMNGTESGATKVQTIAQNLVYHSQVCMFSDRTSPFELEARQHRKIYYGGKVDDVTVVVALVRETL